MVKQHVEKRTVIIIPEDQDALAAVSTFDRKWVNKFETHVENGHAEEVDSSVPGAREFEFERKMIRIPFHREPRSWTDEEREAARERLVGVRAAVAEQRAEAAAKAAKVAKVTAKTVKAAIPVKGKAIAVPAPKKAKFVIEDEEEDDDVEEVDELVDEEEVDDDDYYGEGDEDEDEEEVIVKKPAKKVVQKGATSKPAPKAPAKKGKK